MSNKHFSLNPVILFFMIVLAASALFAQDMPLIEVQSEVDTSIITIGDRINYSITIDRNKDLQIAKPGEGLNLGMFAIMDYEFHDPVEKDGRLIEKYKFNISVYDTGKFTIPPFPIAYFPEDTNKQFKIIEAPAIDIFVQSVISGDDAKELKDIKFPIYIPFNYFFWISMAVIVILVAVITYLGYLLWKRRKEKGYLFSPPSPPRPAHEIALEALEELYNSNLLEEKQFKKFFSRLSEIIRAYLEGRYFLSALEETTTEIMDDAKQHIDEKNLLDDLKNILELSDLIKFAKYIPVEKEIDESKAQSLNFIDATKLIYEIIEDAGQDKDLPQQENEAVLIPAEDDEPNQEKTEN